MARATWKKDKSRPLLPSLLPFFPQIDRAKPHGTETSFLLSPEKNRRREEGKKENLSLSIALSPSVRPLSIRLVKASCSEALSRFFFYIIATMNRQIKKLEDATIRSPPLPSSYTRRSKREARIFGDPSPEEERGEGGARAKILSPISASVVYEDAGRTGEISRHRIPDFLIDTFRGGEDACTASE